MLSDELPDHVTTLFKSQRRFFLAHFPSFKSFKILNISRDAKPLKAQGNCSRTHTNERNPGGEIKKA